MISCRKRRKYYFHRKFIFTYPGFFFKEFSNLLNPKINQVLLIFISLPLMMINNMIRFIQTANRPNDLIACSDLMRAIFVVDQGNSECCRKGLY